MAHASKPSPRTPAPNPHPSPRLGLQEAVTAAAHTREAATLGLAQYLLQLRQASERDGEPFINRVQATVRSLERIDWLVPPMLQGRTAPPVPFI